MYFWTYGLWKTCLDKCLKSSISENHSGKNMVNGPKQSSKLNGSTFTIFMHPCEDNSGLKILFEWYAKSQGYLFTHWLPIISILFLTETISSNIFKCKYLRNKNIVNFFKFFFAFSKFKFNFEHFQEKHDPHSWCIFGFTDSEKRFSISIKRILFKTTLRQVTW